MEPIPEQYKNKAEQLIHRIAELADILYPIINELGDNVEIESNKCIIIIKSINNNKRSHNEKK